MQSLRGKSEAVRAQYVLPWCRVHVAQTGNERPLSLPFSDEEALGGNVAVHAAIAFIITCRCEGKQHQNA